MRYISGETQNLLIFFSLIFTHCLKVDITVALPAFILVW